MAGNFPSKLIHQRFILRLVRFYLLNCDLKIFIRNFCRRLKITYVSEGIPEEFLKKYKLHNAGTKAIEASASNTFTFSIVNPT